MTGATGNEAPPPRIWHQSVNELDHLDVYKRALETHAAEILGRDAKVIVHGLPPGSYGGASATAVLGNAFAYHRILDRVIDNAIAAERQGYDAFVIGSFSEPFLREIRSAVDIPVASLTESGLLVSCSLGSYVALISNAPAVQWMTKVAVDKHKLGARVLEVASMDPPLDEPALARAYSDPAPVIANFKAVAERLVARGADVVIPAEGVLAELLVRHDVREIAGAPVMDVFAVTWAYALMQIRLWSKTGLRVGRSWHHRRDDPAIVARFFKESAMNDLSPTQVAGVYHRRLGDVLVTGLSDGYVDMGYTIFRNIPEEETRAILARDHRASPPRISVNAFALRTGDRTYLVDCGSADLMGPTCGRLPANLAAAGIDPESVNAVLLTHVHPDHSNGLTDVATGTRLFPNAEVVVHENEINHWFDDEAMARAAERPRRRYFEAGRAQLKPYMAADRVRTFKKGEVLPGVTAVPIPGHTPGHAAYVVASGDQSMVIWGDTVHVPEIQVARPEVTMEFDADPDAAAAARQMIFDMVVSDDLLVGGMHLHFPGFGHMRREAGRYSLVAEQWAFEI